MKHSIILFGIPESTLADEVAARLDGASFPHRTVSLDAPFEGKPVTVARGAVSWEGVDLLSSAAVFVERTLFPWPQTRFPAEYERSGFSRGQWSFFQREAASLAVSALHLAATGCPVVNPPSAAHLAVSPTIALDLLAREGIAVHPWRVEPVPRSESAPRGDQLHAGIVVDACGRDRWRTPETPDAGEPALVIEPFEGPVATLMVVGGSAAGAVRFPDGDSWARWQGAGDARAEIDPPGSHPEAADMAVSAASALGLGFAAVSVRTDRSGCSVLLVEASPDLAEWNRILEGRLAQALAEHMISVARRAPSDSRAPE